jgi:hypothetical protein
MSQQLEAKIMQLERRIAQLEREAASRPARVAPVRGAGDPLPPARVKYTYLAIVDDDLNKDWDQLRFQ